jgi:hypothetical protein
VLTLAVHPWFGEEVTVRRVYGTDAVMIERESGEVRIIPTRWTDLQPRLEAAMVEGRAVYLVPEAARALCRWIAARRDKR